jgi:hypothetical protein
VNNLSSFSFFESISHYDAELTFQPSAFFYLSIEKKRRRVAGQTLASEPKWRFSTDGVGIARRFSLYVGVGRLFSPFRAAAAVTAREGAATGQGPVLAPIRSEGRERPQPYY